MLTTITNDFGQLTAPVLLSRLCRACGELIPANRLLAVPHTTICTCCLILKGDVPRIRKFEELRPNGELVETLFVDDPYIEQQLRHRNQHGPNAIRAFDMEDGAREVVASACSLHNAVMEQAINLRDSA